MKSIADMLIIFDKNLLVSIINERACRSFNQTEEDLVGKHISELFSKRQQKFLNILLHDILENDHIQDRETQFKVRGSRNLSVSISLSHIRNENDSDGFILIAKDIRHFLMTTDALKQKNKELETLVYRVSHDLRGPLASVTGLFQLLEYEEKTMDTLSYYLGLIQETTTKLENTLSGLLDIGHSTDGSLLNRDFNVKSCIQDILAGFKGYPGHEDVILLLSANQDLMINTEEKIFRSILQNLIENSIKYRKAHVTDAVTKISARNYKNGIKIKVKDNGQGMSRQVQRRAFDMFYRGNQISEGSGLGLFIVKSGIEKLGGIVRINSQVDRGTEIWIYLPNFDEARRASLLLK